MGAEGHEAARGRDQQVALYGESVDTLTDRIARRLALAPDDIAHAIGLSPPMYAELRAGRRSRIPNPSAAARFGLLRDLVERLDAGEHADTEAELARIRASSPAPAPEARASSDLLSHDSLAAARELVARHVPPTPARRWPLLEQVTGTETWVKHENHNPTGSFKVRGGLTFGAHLVAAEPDVAGLIAATRGNHGQSLAFAGRSLGLAVTIVVPEGNSPDKNAAMRALGAELVVHGRDYQESVERARLIATERGLRMVPAFHRWLVEGVATNAAELHEAVPGLDAVYVPVGMGSGICAQLAVRDLLGTRTEVVGVVSEEAPAYALSFEAGEPVPTDTAHTFVDGVACRTPDAEAVAAIVAGAARIVRVSEAQAGAAMALMYRATHNLAEPAGSLALAGLLAERDRAAGRRVAVVHTGGNCDFDILERVMKEHP